MDGSAREGGRCCAGWCRLAGGIAVAMERQAQARQADHRHAGTQALAAAGGARGRLIIAESFLAWLRWALPHARGSMKRGVMKHGSRRGAPLLTVARHHPPPFRLIFPSTTASSSSSHRARSPSRQSPSRRSPQSTVHRPRPTDSLSLSPPRRTNLCHHRPSGPGRHHRIAPLPATAGPRYPLFSLLLPHI